ncbi:MAG: pitrilysin family protein [Chthoniobacter sp.]|uniref:M16 family metallopeptidase n=1 Tax=Chthoniobacter sp. TaxID=2510640 RepID=UPI0032A3AF20
MEFPYRLSRLPNGVRIASVEMPWMRSVSIGVWAGVGGRHESAEMSGISHFMEHLLFKGTKKRTAKRITESVEGLGGYLNAFTTEDHTCYYAKAASAHLPELCDVLGDMYLESQFAPGEIEREREVIREEILMYRDHPAQHAQELLTATMWPGHPLGRPLTGTVETIGKLRRPHFVDFRTQHYTGSTTIITVAGPVYHERVVELLKPIFGRLPKGRSPRFTRTRPKDGGAQVSLFPQETEQTHLAMGFHAFGRTDERRYALKLLSVILGENMSSRLFQKLRERHGFCYSVQTSMVTLADTGAIQVYAGLDAGNLEKAVKMILRELENICHKAPIRTELKKAQDYTIGQTFMGLESTSNQIMWMGESLLGYGKVLDPSEVERKILAVTPQDIQRVACHCLNRVRLGVAIVGPLKDEEKIKGWLA